jgi:biotin operon repressor
MFDICANRHKGNPESAAANRRIAPHKSTQRERVLTIIRDNTPISCEQIHVRFGIRYTAVSARISELKKSGDVIKVGTTKTETGSTAALYGVK